VFEGMSGLTALTAGGVVAVHGTVDTNKQVIATRAERKSRTDAAAGVRLAGQVLALDTAAKTFKLNDLLVSCAAATVLPACKTLANGQVVAVFADGAPSTGVAGFSLQAKGVKIASVEEGAAFAVGGHIIAFASPADFTDSGVRIDASTASLSGGSVADLGNGANVKISGEVQGELLKADRVEFVALPAAGMVKLKGELRDLNTTAGTFYFLGVNLKLGTAVPCVGGTAADLANGRAVEGHGAIAGLEGGRYVKLLQLRFKK
jgi:hypothetical protein